jgi:Family of unknown function (DUF5675)
MLVQVIRHWYTSHSTMGEWMIDGAFEAYTLEPPKQPDPAGNGKVAIPAGTYHAIKWISPEFSALFNRPFQVIRLSGILNRSDIEVHPGNYPSQTKGCTEIGNSRMTDKLIQSDTAFSSLMNKLPNEFDISYVDGEDET